MLGQCSDMPLFWTDPIVMSYSDVNAAKQWWITAFDCKQVPVPEDWDEPLPSDVALKLSGDDFPTGPPQQPVRRTRALRPSDHLHRQGKVREPIADGVCEINTIHIAGHLVSVTITLSRPWSF